MIDMNSKKMLLMLTVFTAMVTSCLEDKGNYRAGIATLEAKSDVLYANNTSDSLYVFSYGAWKIMPQTGSEWCTLSQTTGNGYILYSLGVNVGKNTTGQNRRAPFEIKDVEHPEVAISFQIQQIATRGDGSLGNAALVQRITSSDGYEARIEYDSKDRPVKYVQNNPDGSTDMQTIAYNETDGIITVNSNNTSLSGSIDNSYQPALLTNTTDTIGYFCQFYPNGMPISYNYVFNFVSYTRSRGHQAYSYLLGGDGHASGQSLQPDSLHLADSLKYIRQWNGDDEKYKEELGLFYSQKDNRCQSVDVNQLILGFAECQPMQLLSLFRYTRSTSIISEARSSKGNIEILTELNSDKSVRMMTVKRGTQTTTYTFEY